MMIWEAEGVCIEDPINEATATAAATVGVFARSRGRGAAGKTRGSGSPKNSISFELTGDGA
jgi:hypothetical protein